MAIERRRIQQWGLVGGPVLAALVWVALPDSHPGLDGEVVPFRFELLINSGNQIRKDVALTLQNELLDIGIDCQVRELDWSIFLQQVSSKQFDAAISGWTGGVIFPPDGFQIWHSSQASTFRSTHWRLSGTRRNS